MIVVGIDGSEESKQALAWALAEAARRHTSLRVVCAWELPIIDYRDYALLDMLNPEVFADRARALIDRTLAEVGADAGSVEIERVAAEGSAVGALIDASRDADLLVVGSRGHGGFVGLLLGSVSQHCAQHATCPVVIVRPRMNARPEAGDGG